jgi:protein-S-isoprenylcysteine O-methyltransferase Ste14
MEPGHAIAALWIAFAASWLAAAIWSSPTDRRLGLRNELAYRLVLVIGGVIFAVPAHGYNGPLRLWHVNETEAWVCVGLIAIGFAFCWWARIQLGPMWSGQIEKKADHKVIDTGPYAIVRHPIYTGILLAVFATAAAKGTVLGLIGAVIITIGIWMKARLEERWLSGELGEDVYGSYRKRVPMLIPVPRARS